MPDIDDASDVNIDIVDVNEVGLLVICDPDGHAKLRGRGSAEWKINVLRQLADKLEQDHVNRH